MEVIQQAEFIKDSQNLVMEFGKLVNMNLMRGIESRDFVLQASSWVNDEELVV